MRTHSHKKRAGAPVDPAELAAAVAEQREELTRMMRDISDKFDVPTHLQETAQEIKDAAEERAQELRDVAQEGAHELRKRAKKSKSGGRPHPAVIAAAAAVAAVGVVAVVSRKRKRKESR